MLVPNFIKKDFNLRKNHLVFLTVYFFIYAESVYAAALLPGEVQRAAGDAGH
jgi:hypothetical protein